jgi:putative efflux protein, MATE family
VKNEKNSLTEGVIWKKLLFFALPLLGTSFIQQLYNTVDLIYVGNFLGKEAAAAVGASSQFVTCLVGFFSGMSVGSSAVTAYVFGSGKKSELKKVIHTTVGLAFICGLIMMAIGLIGAPTFLKMINTPDEIMGMAVSYVRVYFISIIAVVTYNMAAGIIRALGDSKTTMHIQLIGGLVNVVMDAVFIFLFDNGVVGVALATLFSQSVAAGLALLYLMRLEPESRLELKKIRVELQLLNNILKIGIPSGLQALVITVSNVFVQFHVNSLGVDSIAAFTAYFKVELLIYLPILAFGQAISTFTSQNLGASEYERVKKGTRVCLAMGIGVTAVLSALVLAFGRQAFSVINSDPGVLDLGVQIIAVTVPFYFVYLILEVLGGTIRGSGKAVPPMVIILTNICVLRTILLFIIMASNSSITGIAMTYPITWASTALGMAIYYWRGNWMGEFKRLNAIRDLE